MCANKCRVVVASDIQALLYMYRNPMALLDVPTRKLLEKFGAGDSHFKQD